jgi:indolepyruvate ferredoxin oxidoreductase, alpha subunit
MVAKLKPPKKPIAELVDAPPGRSAVLQGNLAFAVGCARGGLHAADGYPGTPSTEVIDKGLRYVQERMRVGWSVNEAVATAVGFGVTMAGGDAVVTMKVPGLFQAADVVATVANFCAPRGGLVLYIATDFVPSSTQYVTDPRYFLKSCCVPVLEPRTHQEMLEAGPRAAELARAHGTPVAVLANGLLCHSEGLVRLGETRPPVAVEPRLDYTPFMNLPGIARRNYDEIMARRLPAMRTFAEQTPLNLIEPHDRRLGVVVHGITELYLREVWDSLPVKPSILSLGITFPLPVELSRRFAAQIDGPIVVLGDGLRFVQEELSALGLRVEGKTDLDPRTEWTPEALAVRLGARPRPVRGGEARSAEGRPGPALAAPPRPATICAGCSYRGFGLVVERLRKKKKITASFGDIGCNTLLYFMKAVDTCACMGSSDSQRQGAVLMDPSLAGRSISVLGDSTECHSGLASTLNAVFRHTPGVKVVLDNRITAMTGGQPAPSSAENLAGQESRFDLVAALRGNGARVEVCDAFDLKQLEKELRAALERGAAGELTVLVVRGPCMQQLRASQKVPRLEIVKERCSKCDLCLVCPGLERDEEGYPRFTHVCSGCGGSSAICAQRCNLDAIVPRAAAAVASAGGEPPPLAALEPFSPGELPAGLPAALRVAVRGVGGQGNLFLGKVLAELAALVGYRRLVKGETHGMAQLGGAVISTFGCGEVYSPVFAPGTVDALVVLELSEVLRDGALGLLRPGGTVLLNHLRLLPAGLDEADYPSLPRIREVLVAEKVNLVEFDALLEARAIGDQQGRAANVVALGVLSTVLPFSSIPVGAWQQAILNVSPGELARRANIAAFQRGRSRSN